VLAAVGLECGSGPMYLIDVPAQTPAPDVYRFIKTLDRSVIVELPMFLSAEYMYWSTTHWHPLVNGYSGYQPPDYGKTTTFMRTFPDDEAIARLRHLDVRYVLVHESFYADSGTALLVQVLGRPELVAHGKYKDWQGWTHVFELDRSRAVRSPD
jgi:hypothetical protein